MKNAPATLVDDDGVVVASGHTPATSQQTYTDLAVSSGGIKTQSIATGTAGSALIKGGPGRLCRAIVTTAGTSTDDITIYDGLSATGTVIGKILGAAAIGTVIDFQMPAVIGIYAANVASGPVATISYI